MSDFWPRVEEIFDEALDVPVDERDAFLKSRCAGDAALEREVRGILSGYETQKERTAADDGTPGERLGPYEIVKKIGAGGMGVVYLARRHEDFEKLVAIKLINAGFLLTPFLAERFRQERQILANLDHPNIARLVDGGVASGGRPYLVMEYVAGVRLDEYCEAHRLSVDQRLDLFEKICAAVHAAHQQLIVHRDLKPGNILVNEDGEPKLLDFGIAKVIEPRQTDADITQTMTAGMLLTPQYASPEQLRGEPCTVASDVYSLGVILYELLAGKRPYDARSTADLISAVMTQEIERPSAVAPEDRRRPLRGDLDGVLMKALAKLPKDRYGSVEQFADDVRRHRQGLPVSAVEGTRYYVARKFVQRHWIGVGAVALILFTLIAGLGATLWQARAAERARAAAEQRFSDARQLANYLLFPLYDSVQKLPRSLAVRADMAGQSLQYLDRLANAKSSDRSLRLELAEGYVRLGTIFQAPSSQGDNLGDTSKALESDQKALALLEGLTKENPTDVRAQLDLAHADRALGTVLCLRGKSDEGIPRLKQAISILDHLSSLDPRNAALLVDAGRAYMALMDILAASGGVYRASAKSSVAETGGEAIKRFESALEVSPKETDALLEIANVYITEANVESPVDPASGIVSARKGLDAFNRLPEAVRTSPEGVVEHGRLIGSIAWSQSRLGQYKEALATLEGPGELGDQMLAADPQNASNAIRVASLYDTLAGIHGHLHRYADTLKDMKKEIAIWDNLIAVDPVKASYRQIRATDQGIVAKILAGGGRMNDALPYAKESIRYLTSVADRPGASASALEEAAIVLMVTPVLSLRDYPKALQYALRADELAKGKDYVAVNYLVMAYANNGKAQDALKTVRRGIAMLPAPAPGQPHSEALLNFEKEEKDVQQLIKTGRLPADFNQ